MSESVFNNNKTVNGEHIYGNTFVMMSHIFYIEPWEREQNR